VDTIPGLDLFEASLTLERDTGTWSVVGDDADIDGTVVVIGRIGERGSTRKVAIPDTIAMIGEPIVFGSTSTVIVPTFANPLRAAPFPLLSMIGGGLNAFRTDVWRLRGDSARRTATFKGAVQQCGQPLAGAATCAV
jgi:hypothetical protein